MKIENQKGFINAIALLIVLVAVGIGAFFYWQAKNDKNLVCIEVTVKAKNPLTGEVKEFGNPCDVPKGWEEVERETVPEEPITFTDNPEMFSVSKRSFVIDEKFKANWLAMQSEECGTNNSEAYYRDLLNKFSPTDQGWEYTFNYLGRSQDNGIFTVTVIPNKLGYREET